MKNRFLKPAIFCFFVIALAIPCKAQTDFMQKAYDLLQAGNYNDARANIDSAIVDLKYYKDGQAWYLRGLIYKTIYNKTEKENPTSPSRLTALESFRKSMELDTTSENRESNSKNIKYLTTALYNDVATSMDTINYFIAEHNFEKFREFYSLVEKSKAKRNELEVKFKLALATVLARLYESHNHQLKYYNLVMRQYDEVLELDPGNKTAMYNNVVMNYGKSDRERKQEKEKLQNELELKSSKIKLLDKDNELKKMTLQQKQSEIEKQKLENEKNEREVSLLNKDNELLNKSKQLNEAEIAQQKRMRNIFIAGMLLMIVFIAFVYRSLRIRNKQNRIIREQKKSVENQKLLVEEKNREITDSIEYALRIQTAILPPQKIIKQYLDDSFILYKPKDIVAGDFYWMENVGTGDEGRGTGNSADSPLERGQGCVLFAACDCTGHGVPGAMVSVVCHNALNRAVREFGLTKPSEILDKTAEIVIENFATSEEDIKDGMDISLVSMKYNQQNTTVELEYSGANNPLWIVRNAPSSPVPRPPSFLEETKADKQPIGMNEDHHPFTNHTFTLNKGDIIYLFTDGFADQFGGDTGDKKLTRKKFKELILSIQDKSMQQQGIELNNFILEFRKSIEQIDDILVMGVRV